MGFIKESQKSSNTSIVSSTGNDATAGRNKGKFLTVSSAVTSSASGDIIYIQPGTYSTSSTLCKDKINFIAPTGVTINSSADALFYNNIGNINTKVYGFADYTCVKAIESTGFNTLDIELNCNSIVSSSDTVTGSNNVAIKFKTLLKNSAASGTFYVLNLTGSNTYVTGISPISSRITMLSTDLPIPVSISSTGGSITISNARIYPTRMDVNSAAVVSYGTSTINLINCEVWGAYTLYLPGEDTTVNATDCTFRSENSTTANIYKAGGTVTANFSGTIRMNNDVSVGVTVNGSYTSNSKLRLWSFTYSGTELATVANHPYSTTDAVYAYSTDSLPSPLIDNGTVYYVRSLDVNLVSLHPTATDAANNTNAISLSGGSGVHYIFGV